MYLNGVSDDGKLWHMDMSDQIKLEFHRIIAVKMRSDSSWIQALGLRNIAKMREHYGTFLWGQGGLVWVDEWESLLRGPVANLIAMCVRDDEHGNDMRQVSPFAGAITQQERLTAIAQVGSHHG